MRGNASRYPDRKETVQDGPSRLKHLLMNCTDKALAGFTVDELMRSHRVDPKVAEYELTIARQRRGESIEDTADRLKSGAR